MRLIDQSVTFIGFGNYQGTEHAIKLIEIAARNCYQSKPKDSYEDSIKFVKQLAKNGHTSTFEHVQISYLLTEEDFRQLWSRITAIGKYRWFDVDYHEDGIILSGNFRAWYETIQTFMLYDFVFNYDFSDCFRQLIHEDMAPLFEVERELVPMPIFKSKLLYQNELPKDLYRLVFKVVCDRATAMEFNRHKTISISQESQRYVNYAKKGFTFIDIPELTSKEDTRNMLLDSLSYDVETYEKLIEKGLQPQFARFILPNLTKVSTIYSGLLPFWEHFLKMRLDEHAHPVIRRLACQIKNFIEKAAI